MIDLEPCRCARQAPGAGDGEKSAQEIPVEVGQGV
jgi:hypothetical protein